MKILNEDPGLQMIGPMARLMPVAGRLFGALILAGIVACAPRSPDPQKSPSETSQSAFRAVADQELAEAACAGDVVRVGAALKKGANPNAVRVDGATPLLLAQACQKLPAMGALLKAGADPNFKPPGTSAGCSAVTEAAAMANPEPLQLLLSNGGDPNAMDEDGSALKISMSSALSSGSWKNYYSLLQHGADTTIEFRGETIAEFAAAMAQYEKFIELLDRGYNHDLEKLGAFVQARDISVEDDQAQVAHKELKRRLEMKGVHFPVRPLSERRD